MEDMVGNFPVIGISYKPTATATKTTTSFAVFFLWEFPIIEDFPTAIYRETATATENLTKFAVFSCSVGIPCREFSYRDFQGNRDRDKNRDRENRRGLDFRPRLKTATAKWGRTNPMFFFITHIRAFHYLPPTFSKKIAEEGGGSLEKYPDVL